MNPRRKLLLAALTAMIATSGCHEDRKLTDPIRVVGRVSFYEASGCNSPLNSQIIKWADCHAFKKHFNPETGEAITESRFVDTAHRPLPSTLHLTVLNPLDPNQICSETEVETDHQGYFEAEIGSCGYAYDVLITGQALLRHSVHDGDNKPHTIVALWKEAQAEALFEDLGQDISQDHAFTSGNTRYAVPSAGFVVSQTTRCAGDSACADNTYNLGGIEVIADSQADSFGYLRQVMSAYATVVSLHERLKENLSQPSRFGDSLDYFKMFSSSRLDDWGPTYRVYFANDWAEAGSGRMNLYQPDREFFEANGLSRYTWLLSSTFTLPHEFGHSIHGALARSSFQSDYDFSNPMMRADGSEYDWGHSTGQYQELGTALSEGIASAIGQYLLNRCSGGGVRQLNLEGGAFSFDENMWNPNPECDAKDGCSYHHVRWHLSERGVREGRSEFERRVTALQNLTVLALESGHHWTTSNTEGRVAGWGCDLLDDNSDVNHAFFTRGWSYLDDFTYHVGETLDGKATSPRIRSYPDTPLAPEEVQINLTELVSTLEKICPACNASIAGDAAWGRRYNRTRLSVHESPLSPQSFMKKLIEDGYVTREQADTALQSSLMELL